MSLINIKIEGIPYQVEEGLTILEAAKKCGYEIPHLCYFNHGECSQGSCRVCLVEVKGARGLVASCVYPVNDGMEISISSAEAVAARRRSVELLLSDHRVPRDADGVPVALVEISPRCVVDDADAVEYFKANPVADAILPGQTRAFGK